MQAVNDGTVNNMLHIECKHVDDNVRNAETRSAPGDLEKPSSSREYHFSRNAIGNNSERSESPGSGGFNDKSQLSKSEESKKRPAGHYRNYNNGFASGPPWPMQKREKPWSTVCVWQKQQQIQAIEKEINVMATESLVGIRNWRPKWLQRFGKRNWMLLWLCWFCTVQGLLVNGLVPSAITSIERRFQFNSSTIGRIMQFYDFGYVLLCIPVSYFGGRHSKPMVLAAGLLLMALGSFIFTMPHNFSDSYTSTHNAHEPTFSKCHPSHTSSGLRKNYALLNNSLYALMSAASAEALRSCPSPENQPGTFRYVFLFCLGHFLHGIGATPLFTLGVSYIDENVGPTLSSLYLGIFYAFAIFGPAFGFLMSSSFLRYHTDFLQSELHIKILNIDETDPKWVGAWWIGFQIASILALIAVFPILVLPKVLPESLKWHRTRLHEETIGSTKKRSAECCGIPSTSKTAAICGPLLPAESEGATTVQTITIGESMPALQNNRGPFWYHIWLDVRHIPIAIYRIISNGSYMLITFAMAVDGFIITGASTFMSKYLERQFSVAPSKANMLIGCIMVPMAGIGTMFSGFIVQRFRLSCVKTLKFCIALLMCTLILSPMYLVYCDHDPLAGIEEHYEMDVASNSDQNNNATEMLPSLKSTCNRHCDCVPSEYHPVCAEFYNEKQISFYSPCFAGCQQNYEPLRKMYYNCSCVPENTRFGYRTVKNGLCESKCRGLFAFLALFAPFCFFAFAVGVPLISVVLRTVDYAERSFALGIQWILVRVIGTIPAPVLFGWMFDVSCIRYNLDVCSGKQGSCMLYQNKLLADLFLAFSVIGQTIAMVFLICTLLFFSSQMRDDPLPTEAVIENSELNQVNEEAEVNVLKQHQK
ncbi:sodium-independent organic anion transporter family protein [Brugia malayi]|uniref:Solute carrier organic anion transporter family member n=4 Tax=Onchocercidae TaxID=6296 RepID=A0A4E9F661_BRUMA|nr:sodium-independent organic anion transporter family protein [Brugia malayi]VIO89601.1 sodium-independent organic anion transporter family protein [Brugia malayi]